MSMHRFGSSGPEIPAIGQGTWELDDGDRASALAALRRGVEAGLTHIDTAEMYGEAEPLVGEAIRDHRDQIFLVSKVLPNNASASGVAAACERSLRRLGTDRLDAYLLHWRGGVPLAETFGAFERLREAGKILSWGVSNFDVEDLDEALAIAGPGRIACNQVLYHLQERAIEHAVLPWCERNGVAVVGYSPFGHGDFPAPSSPGGRALAAVAARHGATPRQVALAFLTRRPSLLTIPKASDPAHATDNAGALALVLSEHDIRAIDEACPRGPKPRHLPMI